jgi:hypothetical protein
VPPHRINEIVPGKRAATAGTAPSGDVGNPSIGKRRAGEPHLLSIDNHKPFVYILASDQVLRR